MIVAFVYSVQSILHFHMEIRFYEKFSIVNKTNLKYMKCNQFILFPSLVDIRFQLTSTIASNESKFLVILEKENLKDWICPWLV